MALRLRLRYGYGMPNSESSFATGEVRYGVFLRPDPQTCATITAITSVLRAQYGLVSAGAFPPHATLAGSLRLTGPVATQQGRLVEAVQSTLAGRSCFLVKNNGLAWFGTALVYDIHNSGGRPNGALVDLASSVTGAVRPLLEPAPAGQLDSDVHEPGSWRGHLGLASHDLTERPELQDEVREFVEGLAAPVPREFRAEVMALYQLSHHTWAGPWWTALRWRHLQSWRLKTMKDDSAESPQADDGQQRSLVEGGHPQKGAVSG